MNTRTPNSTLCWTPPHCPNPNCPFHNPLTPGFRARRCGYHTRLNPPHRVPRFQCRHCRRTFSSQTFATTYWLKRPALLPRVFLATVNGMANRQIARTPISLAPWLAALGAAGRRTDFSAETTMKAPRPHQVKGSESEIELGPRLAVRGP